jgi:hypothetical protein
VNPELRWSLINLFLPLSPFALRVFLALVGPQGGLSMSSIAELPELLFYSIFVCVSILNLNLDVDKKNFESIIRLFIYVLLVLDFVTLGLIYGGKLGPHVWKFTVFAAAIPAMIAPFYRQVFVAGVHNDYL